MPLGIEHLKRHALRLPQFVFLCLAIPTTASGGWRPLRLLEFIWSNRIGAGAYYCPPASVSTARYQKLHLRSSEVLAANPSSGLVPFACSESGLDPHP